MTTEAVGLTKLKVNLTQRSWIALTDAAGRTGDTRTDTVNRALVMYQLLLWLTKEPGHFLSVDNLSGDGRSYRIKVTRLRWWHRMFASEATK